MDSTKYFPLGEYSCPSWGTWGVLGSPTFCHLLRLSLITLSESFRLLSLKAVEFYKVPPLGEYSCPSWGTSGGAGVPNFLSSTKLNISKIDAKFHISMNNSCGIPHVPYTVLQ